MCTCPFVLPRSYYASLEPLGERRQSNSTTLTLTLIIITRRFFLTPGPDEVGGEAVFKIYRPVLAAKLELGTLLWYAM